MRFRDPVTGQIYRDIHTARRDFCAGRRCPECQFKLELNKYDTCLDFSEFNPERAAELMGLQILKDSEKLGDITEEKLLPERSQRYFETGAVRDAAVGKGRYDLLPWGAIHALAQHCERGALHYGERNVDKGIPQKSFIDSGIRHLSMYIQGDAEPHHLVAALWNIEWACEQEIKRPEMIDLPERTEKSGKAV